MAKDCILAIDQGTSGTKAIIFGKDGSILAKGSVPLKTHYLEGAWVEQEPEAIYQNVLDAVKLCVEEFERQGRSKAAVKSCGISNQRETFVLWDASGQPLYNAVVWQCKRSVEVCRELKAIDGLEGRISQKTGLIIDPYFSGTKLLWLYQNRPEIKAAVDNGEAYFGTVDTWLLYKLTKGEQYLTDHTNASRTLFFNLHTLQWDKDLLTEFGLTGVNLPEIKSSAADYGSTDFDGLFNEPLPITAMIGDSHAAAFGEQCFTPGTAKATLGTGCSVLMNIGETAQASAHGMMTTICWSMEGRVDYALEGVIVTCGATIEWLKNELGLFNHSAETEAMATSVADNNGVYLVPAFSGLGAPHWDMGRKAAVYGLTFDCNKNHIVRAALESIGYQLKDVIGAMEADTNLQLQQLMVNGGITANKFVLQFTADLLDCLLVNRGIADVSALGAAYLSGLQSGLFASLDDLKLLNAGVLRITPGDTAKAGKFYKGWQNAIG